MAYLFSTGRVFNRRESLVVDDSIDLNGLIQIVDYSVSTVREIVL